MQRPLGWYLRRIRSMRPLELVHRVGELVTVKRLAAKHRRGSADAIELPGHEKIGFCVNRQSGLPELPWRYPDAATRLEILAGHWPALGFPWQWRDDSAVWHDAPDTGRRWPVTFFGSIPYLSGNPVGDVRVAWEPSRLQQLIALALIAADANDEDAARAVMLLEDQFLSWVAANPNLSGVHYISVMECAQRIMAACHALDMVRARLTRPDEVWTALLHLVATHASIIEKRMSLHSSTGNHTITEAAGLIYAGVLFPELAGASRWRRHGLDVLEREAVNQVLPDGGGREQAFRYLLLVVDLLGLVTTLFKHKGEPAPTAIAAGFERGRDFLNSFATRWEDLPTVGDSDSGFAISRYLRLAWNDTSGVAGTRCFNAAGYTVINDTLHDRSHRIIFDHGPFGMAPLYGHGHADALALTLRIGDKDVLIDPGTFSYTGHPEWRAYFRSTAAHNTVTVDGLDQATQELSFMWSKAYPAELVAQEDNESGELFLLARHPGYQDVGVIHWRGVACLGPEIVLVIDHLAGQGQHELALHWHCGLTPEQQDDHFAVGGMRLSLDGGEISRHRAETTPRLGWQAPVYGVREPADTIRVCHSGALPHRFTTAMRLGAEPVTDDKVSQGLARLTSWMDDNIK